MIDWMSEVEKRKEEILKDLAGWIQINSVYDETTIADGKPFGQGVSDAFDYILELAKRDGFESLNDEGYACHIDYGQGDQTMGILGHVDVVPQGDDWTYDPFSAKIVDGFMHGRGTQDDKGPMLAAYYGMKIIKDLGLPVNKKIRMILGGNEESGWACVDHYFKKYPKPDFGFTPDGEFPLVYAEKQILNYEYTGEYECDFIESIHAGTVANSVPDRAKAILNSTSPKLKTKFDDFLAANNLQGNYAIENDKTIIEIIGRSAHGAMPEKGVNAASKMLNFLATFTTNQMILHFAKMFNDYLGEGLGVNFNGDKMGLLTCNLGILNYENGKYQFIINIRHPLEMDFDKLYASLDKAGNDLGWTSTAKNIGGQQGLYLDLESDLIKTLHQSYIDFTGDTTTKPYCIGGGTYARAAENFVCFGMLFPNSEDRMHQRDECVSIDELIKATAIYTQAIYNLVK